MMMAETGRTIRFYSSVWLTGAPTPYNCMTVTAINTKNLMTMNFEFASAKGENLPTIFK
jgi:hypothetical protein